MLKLFQPLLQTAIPAFHAKIAARGFCKRVLSEDDALIAHRAFRRLKCRRVLKYLKIKLVGRVPHIHLGFCSKFNTFGTLFPVSAVALVVMRGANGIAHMILPAAVCVVGKGYIFMRVVADEISAAFGPCELIGGAAAKPAALCRRLLVFLFSSLFFVHVKNPKIIIALSNVGIQTLLMRQALSYQLSPNNLRQITANVGNGNVLRGARNSSSARSLATEFAPPRVRRSQIPG